MANLSGKAAVVTGGSFGIGKAIAQRFAKDGAQVIIVGRKEGALREAAATDEKISYVAGDATKTETIETIISTVEKEFGRLDILVNDAGWCPVQPITEMTIADYDHAFQLDVRAVVELTIHALSMLRKAKGNIINLSSVGSIHRSKNLSMYQGAKAAVDNFTRVWALELAQDGAHALFLLGISPVFLSSRSSLEYDPGNGKTAVRETIKAALMAASPIRHPHCRLWSLRDVRS